MKNLVLLFLLVMNNCFSQSKSGVVTYNVISTKLSDSITNKNAIKLFEMVSEKFNELEYKLSFNNDESIFTLNDKLKTDNKRRSSLIKQAILFAGDDKIYINNKYKFKIIEEELLGDLILIKDTIVNDWIITTESKLINDYKCFKAYKTIKKDKLRVNNSLIVAWFSPDIPIPFGPNGYSGLPGLILEVEANNIIYYVSTMSLSNNVEVIEPSKGIVMTYDEYQNYVDEKIKEYGFEKN